MDTQASSSHGFKKIKLRIIPPQQLFVSLTSDNENLSTPSLITTSSSPTPPNAPSKTTSTKETTSIHSNTSSSFQSKLQVSPPPINEPTSPQPQNPFLQNLMDVPPRQSNPQPFQISPSLDITLSLSLITPLENLSSPSSPSPPPPQPPIMIILYIQRKENGEMLIDSIKKGQVKLLDEITIKDADGVTDIRLDIYTLINHYHTAKEIWDRIKELMEGTEMTKQERHIAKQCTAKKRDFLVDSLEETDDCEDLQLQATINFKADHVDAYDLDCDDKATANAIFMANLSPVGSLNNDMVEPRYDSDILSKVPYYDTYHDSDMLNSNIQERGYIENIVSNNESYDELTSNSNVISYTDYMLTIGDDADNYVPPSV
ncbi:hypothetical protein Tco_0906370 [Tanacetum coccineum]|uniref:Uncharacterized protein n=1 Tax=Tanacetum coccineum TaxID=301880 RepID=A0ABQ5CGA4_9ASTR